VFRVRLLSVWVQDWIRLGDEDLGGNVRRGDQALEVQAGQCVSDPAVSLVSSPGFGGFRLNWFAVW